MKGPVRIACALVLVLYALCGYGCGGDDPPARSTMSLCGVACVGPDGVDTELHLANNNSCSLRFLAFEESHPGEVCGHAWERLPTSPCLQTAILTTFLAIPCTVKCSQNPDLPACVLRCLMEKLGFQGNCLSCVVALSIDLQVCLGKPSLSQEDVDACLHTYVLQSAECSP